MWGTTLGMLNIDFKEFPSNVAALCHNFEGKSDSRIFIPLKTKMCQLVKTNHFY